MSKITNYIIEQQEQNGINLIKQQREVDYYSDGSYCDPDEIQKELENDPEWQKFLNELEECCF